jgi:DNA replication and repair protein RecF
MLAPGTAQSAYMYLKRLSLTNFRKFTRLDVDIPRQIVLLVGANAQGKTSVLEAIYFLAAFTSFQTHADRQIVNFDEAKNNQLTVARAGISAVSNIV